VGENKAWTCHIWTKSRQLSTAPHNPAIEWQCDRAKGREEKKKKKKNSYDSTLTQLPRLHLTMQIIFRLVNDALVQLLCHIVILARRVEHRRLGALFLFAAEGEDGHDELLRHVTLLAPGYFDSPNATVGSMYIETKLGQKQKKNEDCYSGGGESAQVGR